MDINTCLNISYSGSLDAYRISTKGNNVLRSLKQWFWTYKNNTVDASTRTAYYLILAVKHLKEEFGINPEQLQINLWGLIDPLNAKQIQSNNLEKFFNIEGYFPKQESLERLKKADLLFLPLEKSTLKHRKTLFIPGKLFEYLQIRKPILALCEDSDCKDILVQSGLGICVEPDNYHAIAKTLLEIIKNREILSKMNYSNSFIESFSFKKKTEDLADLLKSISVNSL